jgi:hypothetical protein
LQHVTLLNTGRLSISRPSSASEFNGIPTPSASRAPLRARLCGCTET